MSAKVVSGWFKGVFSRNKRDPSLEDPETSRGSSYIDKLTYAIGDVHGCNSLLRELIELIRNDSRGYPGQPRVVLLGDYIDRGPASREVIDTVIGLQRANWCETIALRGNHEQVLKQFLLDSAKGPDWVMWGGAETLASYGIAAPTRQNTEGWLEARRELARTFPSEHLHFLNETRLLYKAGDYLFVHGGVKPGVPWDQQTAETLLWIRDEFLDAERPCELVVVHGHTASETVKQTPWRIGVDTGAFATGRLTCVRLFENERRFMHVKKGASVTVTSSELNGPKVSAV